MAIQHSSIFHKIGFITLIIMAFSRPFLTTLPGFGLGIINYILPLFFSYFLLIILFMVFNDFVETFDTTSAVILFFSLYVFLTFLWGSDFESIARNLLPFTFFFAAQVFLETPKKVMVVVLAFIVGYTLPLLGSSFLILTGSSIAQVEYYSQVERQIGIYGGIHQAAHGMGFFSLLFGMFLCQKDMYSKKVKYFFFLYFILSVLVLWNTYTRSAYIGLLVFWVVFLYYYNKKLFGVAILAFILILVFKTDTIFNIIFKSSTTDIDLDGASSGRIFIWKHNLRIFLQMPFYRKILGSGLGSETATVMGGADEIWSSHNDWISILMTLGIVGMLVYAGIFFSFVTKILRSKVESKYKGFFNGIILMFLTTTILTNYIGRFEISQSFWFLMGCFYAFYKNTDKATFFENKVVV